MAKWRRLLSLYRVRTTTLFAIFCLVALVYYQTGHEAKKQSNLRQYSKEIQPPDFYGVANQFQIQETEIKDDFVAAVLVICAVRDRAIKNHLEQLLKYRPSANKFPIVISQDGHAVMATEVIKQFTNESNFVYTQNHQASGKNNYNKIATHYKWALDKMFFERGYSHVIITEEDLDIAPDFFLYFAATKRLLKEDETIWCISAWNDNGGAHLIDKQRSGMLWRTDFFPGLGWMLSKELWQELSNGFPEIFWDDWLRRPDIRKGRVCIRPEVSRTAHNMEVAGKGSSKGLYKKYLEAITLPVEPVNFLAMDLDYLLKKNYDLRQKQFIKEAKVITRGELILGGLNPQSAYRATFGNARHYTDVAMKYSLMYDLRSGMPRTAYQGVVTFLANGTRVFFVSELTNIEEFGSQSHSQVYNPDWEHQGRYLEFARQYCVSKWKGVCDPLDPAMAEWIRKKRIKLANWGKMIVI
ncbi:unnamed protein product, partial [Mesorhabditis belari]|uniref:Alpha-1,3-mannosyl-glycoprotein 2-beta-N-acetylglucosaminyltransferase n=1 Tax=Mesorhabditis belari TaxID=2138241 RepID=A0AAF3EGR8_9BILA